jgi:hypothetical protein
VAVEDHITPRTTRAQSANAVEPRRMAAPIARIAGDVKVSERQSASGT